MSESKKHSIDGSTCVRMDIETGLCKDIRLLKCDSLCDSHDCPGYVPMACAMPGLLDGHNGQDAKADNGKPRLTLVPRKIFWAIAAIREYGTAKYKDPDNWRRVEKERYRDAAFRHFLSYLDDPTGVDSESGLPHLWHLATNCAFLCELEDL